MYWVSLLGAHSTPGLPSALLRPLYYVSLADLDILADQHAYVACKCVCVCVLCVCECVLKDKDEGVVCKFVCVCVCVF